MSDFPREPGEVFLDARGEGRAMRLRWHHEADLVVLSLWRDHLCTGTFRLTSADVGDFVDALVDGLRGAPGVEVTRPGLPGQAPAHRAEPLPAPVPPRQRTAEGHVAFTDWVFADAEATQAAASRPA
jgi:hypothetical protein